MEKARRAISIGRREAGKLGSKSIEVTHLLLGLLEADPPLAIRVFQSNDKIEAVRQRVIDEVRKRGEKATTQLDLPLGHGSKLTLAHAAEEAQRLSQGYIGVEHLLLGILREDSGTCRILLDSGVTVAQLEAEARLIGKETARPLRVDGFRDFVAEARLGDLEPVIGREKELDQILQIFSRRARRSVVLIGEAGVGKDALAQGLAQRIADGDVPEALAERQILQVHVSELATARLNGLPILYIRGLFDARIALPAWLEEEPLQIIATGSPLAFRLALDHGDKLARRFEPVSVLPPSGEDATAIIRMKAKHFEKFHGVLISDETIKLAIVASGRFLRGRALPDSALDLLDEAGARVKLRLDKMPPAIARIRARLRLITKEMDYEIANHHFEKVRQLAEEQRRYETSIKEQQERPWPDNTVRAEDLLAVVSARTSLAVNAVRTALARPPEEDLHSILAARVPAGRRDWIDGLLAHLADCSVDDADHLLQAIGDVRAKL